MRWKITIEWMDEFGGRDTAEGGARLKIEGVLDAATLASVIGVLSNAERRR
jgi:hypothetical protein